MISDNTAFTLAVHLMQRLQRYKDIIDFAFGLAIIVQEPTLHFGANTGCLPARSADMWIIPGSPGTVSRYIAKSLLFSFGSDGHNLKCYTSFRG